MLRSMQCKLNEAIGLERLRDGLVSGICDKRMMTELLKLNLEELSILRTKEFQRLMGRRTRSLLPRAESLLQPNSNTNTTAGNLVARKRLQWRQYNRGINIISL